MSYMASSFGHKCRGLFKLAVAVTGVLILLQYVFGVAVIGGFRSWRGHLTYDVNDTLGADRHDGRRFMDRNAWRDDVTLGLHRRVEQDTGLPLCPMIPPNLKGQITMENVSIPSFETMAALHPELDPGGLWRPTECRSRHHVAIVVPYRDREEQLRSFLKHMHPFLQHQQLDYGIYIVDQALPTRFNRALLMNIGYAEASKQANYSCYIFHDVDLLPEDDRNLYSCPEHARHMSAAVDKFHYRIRYASIFGGVSAFKTADFELINGFSNQFFGWGGEDDDLRHRVSHHHVKVSRYPMAIARYVMVKHTREKLNKATPKRITLLKHARDRFDTDGLNSLEYELLEIEKRPLYTRLYVRVYE